ncbi:hypothetical protein F8M41_004341 [Gigaspora margarita]|uniref:Uncharacterized protein n=1 Tax=Gigaspora margarita TaxID=4874 RepID=A0A8H3XCD5_GIGMA|nr:hypothetical protein F8M41_004341 [Gigaspora margarita]
MDWKQDSNSTSLPCSSTTNLIGFAWCAKTSPSWLTALSILNPPPRTDDYIVKLKHVSEEIDMKFMEIYEKITGIYPKSYKKPYENWRLFLERNVLIKLTHRMVVLIIYIKLTLFTFNDILQVEQRYCTFLPFDPTIALPASYTTLGCVSDMKDKILKWAYKKAIEELPEEIFTGNK